MPIYEYECTNCHHHFDQMQKMSDTPVKQCPQCMQDTVRRLISAAGFQLKGSGWYATDFKNNAKPTTTADTGKETSTKSADKVETKEVSKSTEKSTKGDSE